MSASPLLFDGARLTLARDGNSALVSLFNPPHGYFDAQSERELLQALDIIDAQSGLCTVVLTGREPGVFVRHYDVGVLERIGRTMQERGLSFSPEAPPPESGFHRCAARLEAGNWITIAAIGGWCMGGGLELALACNLRYAQAGDYLLGLPEVQLGIIPGGGGTQKLGRAVGHTRSLEMLLLGTCVDPVEAARIGLVHAVVPDALAHAQAIARTLGLRSPEALLHIARLHAMAGQADGMAAERGAFSHLVASPFALVAMADFNGGRRSFPEADQ